MTQAETNQGQFKNCGVSNSSWHGTRVAGIIGALTNNSEGVAGSTWSSWILPVRALGKCGGFDSDILEAMAWAGGLHVNGVPDNPYPAKIENLSLGANGPCTAAYGSVVSQLAARGVLVVASAGNEGGPVGSPANCVGVAGVTGLRHAGTKVGFASLGPEVAIGAPGGNCVNVTGGPCLFSIDTTSNAGTTTPGAFTYTNQTNVNVGTSFSAPIVSGIVGLMAGANGNLGSAQLLARLREGATTPFPVSPDPTIPMCHVPANQNDVQTGECNCTTSTCGAGMANAAGALDAALRPIAALSAPPTVLAGQNVNLTGAGSAGACNRTISTYFWQVVSGAGVLTGPNNTASTSVNAPVPGSFTVRLTVTDDARQAGFGRHRHQLYEHDDGGPGRRGQQRLPGGHSASAAITVAPSPASASLVAGSGTQVFTRDGREREQHVGHLARRRRHGRQRDGRYDLGLGRLHGTRDGAVAGDRDRDRDVGRRPDEVGIRTGDDHGASCRAPPARRDGRWRRRCRLRFVAPAERAHGVVARLASPRLMRAPAVRLRGAAQLVTIVYSSAARRTLD